MKPNEMLRLWDKIANGFFPRRCAVCHDITDFDRLLCNDCEAGLGIIGENCCEKCGKPPEDCVCGVYPQEYEACASAVEYYEAGKDIIREFKFNGQSSLARDMASLMAEAVSLRFADESFDIVVAAPMRRRAQADRGYNQSELLARELARLLELPYRKGALRKLRDTEHQAALGAGDRLVNLEGAIGVSKDFSAKDMTVLLVDDIMTTGATINECVRALKRSGAKAVYAATFATAVRDADTVI